MTFYIYKLNYVLEDFYKGLRFKLLLRC